MMMKMMVVMTVTMKMKIKIKIFKMIFLHVDYHKNAPEILSRLFIKI